MASKVFSRAVVVVAYLVASGPALEAQHSLSAVMRDTALANGLHVVVVANPTVPLVTIQVTIRNGAFTQLEESDEGVPHLLEHMLFRSYGRSGFSSEAYDLQASYNGTTGDETVTYYMTLPSSNLDRALRSMGELVRSPRFQVDQLVSEREVVRGELHRAVADPRFLLDRAVDERVWGTGWGRKNAIGNAITIQNATVDRLKRMYDRFYLPNNAALVLTGDVTAEAAFGLVARHFSGWRAAEDPFATLVIPPMPPLQSRQVVPVTAEATDITILVRWQGPSVHGDPVATYAADVFSSIVNNRTSGMRERLVDSGLFQRVSMSYLTRAHVGPVSLEGVTTADRLVEASAALRAEVARFGEPDYVTGEGLAIAKKQREVDWAMAMETPSGLAFFVGEFWSVAGLGYLRGYLDGMEAVQAADIHRYVSTYLDGKPWVVGIMASSATRRELGARFEAAMAPWRN